MSIYKRWCLIQSPIPCRQSILNYIGIHFKEDGTVMLSDTNNGGSGNFTINGNVITIGETCWTQMGGFWEDPILQCEAELVDNFMIDLINKPFTFKVDNTTLTIYYNNEVYYFKEI
jgi:heat shock protein HslJ